MNDARRKELTKYPKGDESPAMISEKPNKQSFDYVWRTGVAGGLAGSAVCSTLITDPLGSLLTVVGKNSRGSS